MTTVGISELRSNLPKLIKQTSDYLERVIVTVGGKPKAVLLSLEELESIEETAGILAIPGSLEKINKGIAQAKKHQGVPLSKLK